MKSIFLSAMLVIFSAATPAMACLNDRETVILERMFRSSYKSPANPGGEDIPDSSAGNTLPSTYQWNGWAVAASVAGVLMIAGGTWLGQRRLASRG